MIHRTYSELLTIPSLMERYRYLRIRGRVGEETFGCHRYLNQQLYGRDERWKEFRREIIVRDHGRDMALPGFEIPDGCKIIIHHLNPITIEDFLNNNPDIFNPENVVCVSFKTHQAIHYGNENLLPQVPIERRKNDTCLWRK